MSEIFHIEIRSTAPERTAEFLRAAFSWSITGTPDPNLSMFDTPGGFEGHIGTIPDGDIGPSTLNYIRVKDIEEAEKKIVEAGAKLLSERGEAPNMGYYTYFEIPGGVKMVLWQDM